MKNIMIGANRYIRGPGILMQVGGLAEGLGKRALVIGGRTALSKTLDTLTRSFQAKGVSFALEYFTTEVCQEQAYAFRDTCLREKANFIIGVGGGKALDISKWVADLCRIPCITIPTCASTCACMVSLIVTYHENGLADKGIYSASSPWLCLVDTEIITQAPPRLMLSGIADTLSKWPETHYAMRNAESGIFNYLTASLGKEIYDSLLEKCPEAMVDINSGCINSAMDEIIDIIFFMSALVGNTAGNDFRLAIAHSIHDGLIEVNPNVVHTFLHGEKVGYGTLVQLALLAPEVSKAHLHRVHRLFRQWNLPTSITIFGLDGTDDSVNSLVRASRGPKIQDGPSHTSFDDLKRAILDIESLTP